MLKTSFASRISPAPSLPTTFAQPFAEVCKNSKGTGITVQDAGASYGSSDSSGSELLSEFLDHVDRICLQIVVRDLKDRSFGVLIDGHDDLGVLHAGHVLNGAGNAEGHIELGSHDFSGLADLRFAGHEVHVNHGAGGTKSGPHLFSKLVESGKALFVKEAATAGYDALGGEQIRTVASHLFHAHELKAAGRRRHGERFMNEGVGIAVTLVASTLIAMAVSGYVILLVQKVLKIEDDE